MAEKIENDETVELPIADSNSQETDSSSFWSKLTIVALIAFILYQIFFAPR